VQLVEREESDVYCISLTFAFKQLYHKTLTMAVIHIVHFQYNRSACDAATKADIADRFLKLKQKCLNKDGKPYILDITGGTNNSPEGVAEKLEVSAYLLPLLHAHVHTWMPAQLRSPSVSRDWRSSSSRLTLLLCVSFSSLQHSFVVKFANLQDRDYYLSGDAVHAEFGKYVHGNGLERAVVLDFEEGVF
jgi:hypothetical protein